MIDHVKIYLSIHFPPRDSHWLNLVQPRGRGFPPSCHWIYLLPKKAYQSNLVKFKYYANNHVERWKKRLDRLMKENGYEWGKESWEV